MPLIGLYNPVCGDCSAQRFFESDVVPLLQAHNKALDALFVTKHPGHAGELVFAFLQTIRDDVTIILGSGDGTLHEILNFLALNVTGSVPRLRFVVIPCGTANALYSSIFPPSPVEQESGAYRLKSLQSYLDSSRTIPLTLAIATLWSRPNDNKPPQSVTSAVVLSTSLHASILHDSEALREEIPGIQRRLLPAPDTGKVQIYNPATQTFVDHPESNEADPIVDLDGPFAYFLSTVNVDRLEPNFRIAPLAQRIPSKEATCEVVLVRPMRDPSIHLDSSESRSSFVPKLWTVLTAAYQDGAHIDLRYTSNGDVTASGDGPVVVEYIRCGGWEWIPVSPVVAQSKDVELSTISLG
ncbi:hypothetical protein H0H93_012887 [Arthromyces matolae]|nr:hypothetical protein H0H93_012887 [Arthromyces matolae]